MCLQASDEAWKDILCTKCPRCIQRNGDYAFIGCLKCIVSKGVPGFWEGMTRKDVDAAPGFDHTSLFN